MKLNLKEAEKKSLIFATNEDFDYFAWISKLEKP